MRGPNIQICYEETKIMKMNIGDISGSFDVPKILKPK